MAKKTDPEKLTKFLQSDIIRRVSDNTGYTQESISEVVHGMEQVLNEMVLSAKPDKDITIYPLIGVRVESKFRDSTMRHYQKKGDVVIPEGVTITAHVTKDYRRVRNNDYHKKYNITTE